MENMTELERKFIIMARIAVALNRKGVNSGVNFVDGGNMCCLTVRLASCDDENYQIETHFDFERTEEELLKWWAAIDGEK